MARTEWYHCYWIAQIYHWMCLDLWQNQFAGMAKVILAWRAWPRGSGNKIKKCFGGTYHYVAFGITSLPLASNKICNTICRNFCTQAASCCSCWVLQQSINWSNSCWLNYKIYEKKDFYIKIQNCNTHIHTK